MLIQTWVFHKIVKIGEKTSLKMFAKHALTVKIGGISTSEVETIRGKWVWGFWLIKRKGHVINGPPIVGPTCKKQKDLGKNHITITITNHCIWRRKKNEEENERARVVGQRHRVADSCKPSRAQRFHLPQRWLTKTLTLALLDLLISKILFVCLLLMAGIRFLQEGDTWGPTTSNSLPM